MGYYNLLQLEFYQTLEIYQVNIERLMVILPEIGWSGSVGQTELTVHIL